MIPIPDTNMPYAIYTRTLQGVSNGLPHTTYRLPDRAPRLEGTTQGVVIRWKIDLHGGYINLPLGGSGMFSSYIGVFSVGFVGQIALARPKGPGRASRDSTVRLRPGECRVERLRGAEMDGPWGTRTWAFGPGVSNNSSLEVKGI